LSEPLDTFATPPPRVQADAVRLVSASLRSDTADMNAVLAYTLKPWFGPLIHAALNLSRALASRLVTPEAMGFVDGGLAGIANEDPDPDRQRAGRLLLAHSQLSPTEPIDDGDVILHNAGAEQFNDALNDADKDGRFVPVFLAALTLWSDLLNGGGAQVLDDVAAELWGAE
jgi:hypothetical protein